MSSFSPPTLDDQLGELNRRFPRPPERVVSLVPSVTESLFDLGVGQTVVGITDYCTYPAGPLAGLPRLGGPKNPRVADIIALAPDLVIANQEENTLQTLAGLEQAGIPVWLTFPQTVRQALDVLWAIAGLFHNNTAALRLKMLESAVEWTQAAAADRSPRRYFCPIWTDRDTIGAPWWMTFNQHTYCHDLLALLGGENVFAGRQRRYPLAADLGQEPAIEAEGRDTRYPRLSAAELQQASPELILLPSEPFEFQNQEEDELRRLLPNAAFRRVDGSLITWHGTRLGLALRELPAVFD